MVTKKELRKTLLLQRSQLTREEWQVKSDRLCHHLCEFPLFQQAQTVLTYCSVRQEPDLSPLLTQPKTWGLSRCLEKTLVWHHWAPDTSPPLQPGQFGILEPPPECPILQPQQVDLLLIPAVGCDRRGYRLGYGGGFYDRLLSQPEWAKIPAIAILFDFAVVSVLPNDLWDQPLSHVCTESGLIATQPETI
ncbi:MAG TPA: 5-formyltetrahydrofolate cyclo-ligase [Leptolyngbyaceae cyanobacterium M33_DOE_097]|uniref:5-formyltetrahydrofolate cyclo-ligase n=1 Tax=Oscillatoriales cyanobacterium SpSt-418 TaxID=2282169 RepID=A0A7C3PI18_9CYAN|nr:5-formyltetrahydrofolate cyclo-ligase [Leptolyngbyaceae cyanobacterium M33_DOE_097]